MKDIGEKVAIGGIITAFALSVLVPIGVTGLLIWAAIHFVRKFW